MQDIHDYAVAVKLLEGNATLCLFDQHWPPKAGKIIAVEDMNALLPFVEGKKYLHRAELTCEEKIQVASASFFVGVRDEQVDYLDAISLPRWG